MSSRVPVLARTAGLVLLISCFLPLAHSQGAQSRQSDLDGWKLTGASSMIRSDSALALPAGAQLSRVFGSDESVSARVRFEAVLSAEPEDVVSVQVDGATLALARVDERVVVLSAEKERLAEEPLLSVELGSEAEAAVAVGLDALFDEADATVRIEVAGKSVEWRTSRADGESFEFALSAGVAGPLILSEFDFAVDRETCEVVGKRAARESPKTHAKSAAVEAAPAASAARAAVAREESGSQAAGHVSATTAALPAESRSGAPPGGGGLEVFTPPSVRRHAPNENAIERAQEVTP